MCTTLLGVVNNLQKNWVFQEGRTKNYKLSIFLCVFFSLPYSAQKKLQSSKEKEAPELDELWFNSNLVFLLLLLTLEESAIHDLYTSLYYPVKVHCTSKFLVWRDCSHSVLASFTFSTKKKRNKSTTRKKKMTDWRTKRVSQCRVTVVAMSRLYSPIGDCYGRENQ